MTREIVDAGQPWSGVVPAGGTLTITDLEGRQAVDFLCYDAASPADRYSATNTVKVQGNVYVGLGTVLYADSGAALLTVIEDTIGRHDTVYGCCSNPNNMLRYGIET
ncbi:MAG: urea carboxylase-associated family protein, partial [Pseudomonadota bacterium]